MEIKKASFLGHDRPLNTSIVVCRTPEDAMNTGRDSVWDGADALGVQIEHMPPELRTEENLRRIFSSFGNRPIYVTNYKRLYNENTSYDELLEGLLKMLRCGATLLDVMGDFYCPDPIQITMDREAIAKQKAAIERIHDEGGEVLMSSHVQKFLPGEEVLKIALEHQSRGADISKIVTAANSPEEEAENLKTVALLKRELDIPFLFLANGTHFRILRTVGPFMGVCMWLTVQRHVEDDTLNQPMTRAIRDIAANFDYIPQL